MRRLIAAVAVVFGILAGPSLAPPRITADVRPEWPSSCSAWTVESRAAGSLCWHGDSTDGHRVVARVYNKCHNGGYYFSAVGPWRSPLSQSWWSETSSCLRVVGASYQRTDCCIHRL